MTFRILLATVLLAPFSAVAATAAQIELLQSPAWLVRGGQEEPLTRAAELRSGDIIRTGNRARVRIGLTEGSDLKIGPSARVELPRLQAPEQESGIFESLVEIVRGAFRFTTGQLGVDRRRDLEFRVGAVVAGIRGTDIWGKAAADRDFVVLIEGEIEVGTGEPSGRLDEPGTAYIQPKDGDAIPSEPIAMATIREFAQETEPVGERGRLTPDGRWRVMLDSLRERSRAQAALARYRAAGYPVELESVGIDGRDWHRIVLAGAPSRESARAWAAEFERRFDVRSPWLRRE
ncbi:MAG: SPOR domain-containing protein [Halofilum sp. (in: g-proteobacteria)]|nr:SPOR domain-containing protein [Halofilum sp. (in: g-proteobacteria)]